MPKYNAVAWEWRLREKNEGYLQSSQSSSSWRHLGICGEPGLFVYACTRGEVDGDATVPGDGMNISPSSWFLGEVERIQVGVTLGLVLARGEEA